MDDVTNTLVHAPAVPTVTVQPVPKPDPETVMFAPPYVLIGSVVERLDAVRAPPADGVTVTEVSDDFTVPQVTDTTNGLVPERAGVVQVIEVYTPSVKEPETAGDAQAVEPMLIVQPLWKPVPVTVAV